MEAGGPTRILKISFDLNLLQDTVDFMPQFDLLYSAAKSASLQDDSDSELSRGVVAMGLRVSSFLFPLLSDLCFH